MNPAGPCRKQAEARIYWPVVVVVLVVIVAVPLVAELPLPANGPLELKPDIFPTPELVYPWVLNWYMRS